jgi:hypothetical protein
MARIEIANLLIDENVEEKFWRHGLTPIQVRSVLDNWWIVTHNRKDRAASHVLIGRDDQGQCLAIPVVRTDDPVVWRPITAWRCKPREAALLDKRRRIMDAPVNYKSDHARVDDEDRELMDAESWDWDSAEEGVTLGDPGAVLPIRLTFEQYQRLFDVAHAQGLSTHEFIKQAALAAVQTPTR